MNETLIKLQGTGGWLRSGGEEERYIMIWASPSTQLFELPTGGCEFMRRGKNLMSLARKDVIVESNLKLHLKELIAKVVVLYFI